jgi:hypothetical protein
MHEPYSLSRRKTGLRPNNFDKSLHIIDMTYYETITMVLEYISTYRLGQETLKNYLETVFECPIPIYVSLTTSPVP